MTNRERAKQFLPFDAMKGLTEAIREREERRLRVPRRELSEESAADLSYALSEIERGSRVVVTFYLENRYVTIEGTVTSIDATLRHLTLGNERIHFSDIIKITRV